jgi:hypothetical protein
VNDALLLLLQGGGGQADSRAEAIGRLQEVGQDAARQVLLVVLPSLADEDEEVRLIAYHVLVGWLPEFDHLFDLELIFEGTRETRLAYVRNVIRHWPEVREAVAERCLGWEAFQLLTQEASMPYTPPRDKDVTEDVMKRPAPTRAVAEGVDHFERFDLEYPEELPDRLQWLERELSIRHERLVRLLDLPAGEGNLVEGRGWATLIGRFERRAEQVEHLLTHYLSYFDYETEAALRFTQRFPDRVHSGEISLESPIPGFRAGAAQKENEEALVRAIFQDGGALLPAMAYFLSLTSNAG